MDREFFLNSVDRAVFGPEETLDQVELKAIRLRSLRASMSLKIKRVEAVLKDMAAAGGAS